jgi:hypothetical protein
MNGDLERLQSAARALGEHFDSVQIVCTRHDPIQQGGTVITHAGVGNWYARFGSIRSWLVHNDESMRLDERDFRKPTEDGQ